ncbi:MAG: ABC transporter substrate-binding protein [Burkholderiales bacterium]|nr:ABC transporter substrate-binding protein [Burkholderiales bacterium]
MTPLQRRPSSPPWLPRRSLLRAGLGACLAPLAACAPPVPTLRVGVIVFPGYEPLFVAREAGRVDPHVVRLVEMRSSTDTQQALGVRQLEAAAMTLDEVLVCRAEGLDLRVVAVLDESAGADAVVARAPWRVPRDLAGRRVGVEAGAVSAVMLDAMLQSAGLGAHDIIKVPVTQATAVRLWDERRLDAVVTCEPFVSALERGGATRVFDSSAVPGRIVDVLAVTAEAIERQPQSVQRLVAAHFDGLRLMRAQPAEAAQVVATRLRVPPAEVPAAFRGLHQPDVAQVRALLGGDALRRSAEALRQLMLAQGLLPRDPGAVDRLVDPRFLPVES